MRIRKNREVIALVITGSVFLIMIIILGIAYSTNRANIVPVSVIVRSRTKSATISRDTIHLERVEGVLINGKGEEQPISARGTPLREILEEVGIEAKVMAKVIASDEYSAAVSAVDIAAEDKVYIILGENGRLRMIVFGDPDSKRDVNDIERIEVE